jgi:glycosyltransferase involved in cell wall biosynthesis
LLELLHVYIRERPDIVHHIAMKPIFYGTMIARLLYIKAVVNAPVGLGYVFSSKDTQARLLRPFIRLAYRLLLNPSGSRVIFENQHDLATFVRSGAVVKSGAILIRGAGVDTVQFAPHDPAPGTPVVMLVARMLVDKGVMEFLYAAKAIHDAGIEARFVLVGDSDPGNPGSIDAETLMSWNGRSGVEWWGRREDIADVLRQAHIVCLPSYREGLPKSLLEASASGLPIVTTDAVGCRDVVTHGVNGLLVPTKQIAPLVCALRVLILDPELRHAMGANGRKRAVNEFSLNRVIAETLAVYRETLHGTASTGSSSST